MSFVYSDKVVGGDAAFVEQSPPKVSHPQVVEPSKAGDELSVGGSDRRVGSGGYAPGHFG